MQPERLSEIEQRLENSTVPRKCRCHVKVFRSLTRHPKLVYSMKTCSWPLSVLWYSCFIPRLNFLVSYGSEHSAGIFFMCKHAGRSKDPRCENWNCQLLACYKVLLSAPANEDSKSFSQSSITAINGSASDRSESLDTARLFRLFLAITTNN